MKLEYEMKYHVFASNLFTSKAAFIYLKLPKPKHTCIQVETNDEHETQGE